MDMKNLTDLVTKEVMKRLESIEKVNNMVKKDKILLLNLRECSCLDYARKKLSEAYDIETLDSSSKLEEYKACILCSMSNKEIANISLGLCNSNVEDVIMKFLLMGKEVYLVESGIEYRRYLNTASPSLVELYREYEKKLIQYGVKLIKEFKDVLNEDNKSQTQCIPEVIDVLGSNDVQSPLDLTRKKLISEADLKKSCIHGVKEVIVSKKSVITPLAQDFIRINHLAVKKV